jgi:hypothetical protein
LKEGAGRGRIEGPHEITREVSHGINLVWREKLLCVAGIGILVTVHGVKNLDFGPIQAI